jgi:hypothetical protein
MCPPVPEIAPAISISMITKLKKLAYNKQGIPKPPDLGYVLPPIPSMEEM